MASLVGKLSKLAGVVIEESKPRLAVFMKYAKVELVPPTPGEIPQAIGDLKALVKKASSGAYKNTTVKEAVLNTCITIEVLCWFYIGEVIGKRHLVGYNV